MFSLNSLVIAIGLVTGVTSTQSEPLTIRGVVPTAYQAPSPDQNVSTYVSLSRGSKSLGVSYLEAWHKQEHGVVPAYTIDQGVVWYVNLEVEGKSYPLIMDTGSSDTWIAKTGYQCLNNSEPVPESECPFGDTYCPGSGFIPIPDENFNIEYGGGSNFTGTFGNVTVTLGGISVKQQVAVVDQAGSGVGDVACGYMGLAYPSITFAFSGTNSDNDEPSTQIPYNPLFFTMWKEKKIPPVFSIALNRPLANPDAPDGYLALGGLAPVATYGAWASSPIQYVALGIGYINGSLPYPQYQWYTITPDAFLFEGSDSATYEPQNWSPLPTPKNGSQIQVMLDSGTTLIYLPPGLSDPIAALFSPPAIWNNDEGVYTVPCNATAPYFAVKIGGIIFEVDKRDMIMEASSGQGCISGISNGEIYAPYILGDVFMKNVLVVFDVGAGELRFASRGHY